VENKDESLFTEIDSKTKKYVYKKNRPILLVSSTSWTKDEDFSILLDAMQKYEEKACKNKDKYPTLKLVITGKGP